MFGFILLAAIVVAAFAACLWLEHRAEQSFKESLDNTFGDPDRHH